MIYTSYYGNLKKIDKKIEPISISQFTPKGIHIFSMEELAPSKELLNWWKNCEQTKEDEQNYIDKYNQQLCSLNPQDIQSKLYELSCGKDVVLLCYEKPTDFCHRHLVATWFNENNIECKEY